MLKVFTLKSKAANTARSPIDLLKSRVGNINQVPTLPEAATKALAVANDPRSSMRDLAAVIETDPPLAASVLKMVNSAVFWSGRAIESLHQAVVRLGTRECQNLIMAVGMHSIMRKTNAETLRNCELLWRHSFTVALLCRRLNKQLNLGFQGEEFSCGLMHDIARILFAVGCLEQFLEADPLDFDESPAMLEREREILGTDHCHFGAWFADNNQLPGTVISTVQHHHKPEEASEEHRDLVAFVATADQMANFLQRRQADEAYDLGGNTGFDVLSQRRGDSLRQQLTPIVEVLMSETLKEVEQMVPALT